GLVGVVGGHVGTAGESPARAGVMLATFAYALWVIIVAFMGGAGWALAHSFATADAGMTATRAAFVFDMLRPFALDAQRVAGFALGLSTALFGWGLLDGKVLPRWLGAGAVAAGVWLFARHSSGPDAAIVARVKRGPFVVTVTTAGELRAKKFVQVTAPPQLQQAGVYQIKIASLVPEGTMVKQGEQVAELDRSALASKLADVTLALQKAEAQYEQAQLDSALNLSGARESIRTMELGLEE